MKKHDIIIIIVLTILTLIVIFGSLYNPFNEGHYIISGKVVQMEINWGGCQHTDWTYVGFEDGRYFYWNPSIEIVENLPVNETYTFYLQDFDMGDGPGTWLDRIDDEHGNEIWRSARYE